MSEKKQRSILIIHLILGCHIACLRKVSESPLHLIILEYKVPIIEMISEHRPCITTSEIQPKFLKGLQFVEISFKKTKWWGLRLHGYICVASSALLNRPFIIFRIVALNL